MAMDLGTKSACPGDFLYIDWKKDIPDETLTAVSTSGTLIIPCHQMFTLKSVFSSKRMDYYKGIY